MPHCVFNYRVPPPYKFATTDIGDEIMYMLFYIFALRGQV